MPKNRFQLFQIDAFTSRIFGGNPAAVCPLESWLEDAVLQAIAAENNLSETAFFVSEAGRLRIRWFTPRREVDLCGHATLASGYVLWEELGVTAETIQFDSRSGPLSVRRRNGKIELDFPRILPMSAEASPGLIEALGRPPVDFYLASESPDSGNYMAVYQSEKEVRELRPDNGYLETLGGFGVVVTAPGQKADFVSRYFVPSFGIPEDPVTGSTHCTLTPYWAERLDKTELTAHQVSPRGGELWCRLQSDRVAIAGDAVCYFRGWIEFDPENV